MIADTSTNQLLHIREKMLCETSKVIVYTAQFNGEVYKSKKAKCEAEGKKELAKAIVAKQQVCDGQCQKWFQEKEARREVEAQLAVQFLEEDYHTIKLAYQDSKKRVVFSASDFERDAAEQSVLIQSLAHQFRINYQNSQRNSLPLCEELLQKYIRTQNWLRDQQQEGSEERAKEFAWVIDSLNKIDLSQLDSGNQIEVQCYGSQVTGILLESSDTDLTLLTKNYLDERVLLAYVSAQLEHQQQQKQQKQQQKCAVAAENQQQILFQITSVLGENVGTPVLQLRSCNPSSALLVEVTANNYLGCVNSKLLRTYMNLHPKVALLAKLVKAWARRVGVQSKKCLKSYALMLLVVHYLQNAGYLPILQQLNRAPKDTPAYKEHIVLIKRKCQQELEEFEADLWFESDLQKIRTHMHCENGQNRYKDLESVLTVQLLAGFFEYYSDYKTKRFKIDISKQSNAFSANTTSQAKAKWAFDIEDPFDVQPFPAQRPNYKKKDLVSAIRKSFDQAHTLCVQGRCWELFVPNKQQIIQEYLNMQNEDLCNQLAKNLILTNKMDEIVPQNVELKAEVQNVSQTVLTPEEVYSAFKTESDEIVFDKSFIATLLQKADAVKLLQKGIFKMHACKTLYRNLCFFSVQNTQKLSKNDICRLIVERFHSHDELYLQGINQNQNYLVILNSLLMRQKELVPNYVFADITHFMIELLQKNESLKMVKNNELQNEFINNQIQQQNLLQDQKDKPSKKKRIKFNGWIDFQGKRFQRQGASEKEVHQVISMKIVQEFYTQHPKCIEGLREKWCYRRILSEITKELGLPFVEPHVEQISQSAPDTADLQVVVSSELAGLQNSVQNPAQ